MLATQDVYPSSTAHLDNEERRRRFREKAYAIDVQILSLAQDAAELAATDAWDEDGSATAIDWIRFNGNMTSNAAADLVAVGKNLQRMPESAKAVYQGEIGFAHVKAMARTAAAVGAKFDEAPLLEKARENSPASSITSATTTGIRLTAKALRPSRPSWWRTASSGSAPAKTGASCSAETSTPREAPQS